MRKTPCLITLLLSCGLFAQPNCEAYKYHGDDLKYRACKVAEKRAGHYQFSRAYQEALDEALAIDSTFAYAYKVKSTAYLKSGDFITWKELIDQAVKYDPEGELFYRASCRYQFFRDYQGEIDDIDLLDSLVDYDIGYSQNGDYHLNIVKALCYKGIGSPNRALEIFEEQLCDSTHFTGIYDYLHLGVLYLEMGNYSKALESFKRQELENDIAENRYYSALAYKAIGNRKKWLENLELAKKKHEQRERMFDPYTENMDQIFLSDILNEIEVSLNSFNNN